MNELALFAGAGGGILAGDLLGWTTVCAVERDAYAAQILAQRQNDGILSPFPIWSDVQTFDGSQWRGIVDVVSGGFPCQDISAAGSGAGIDGSRSGLWRHMARIVGEVRPRFVFVENSPLLVRRGLAVVISDLAQMGYDAEWCIISASDCGAPHKRDRLWIVAYPNSSWELQQEGCQQDERGRTSYRGEEVADPVASMSKGSSPAALTRKSGADRSNDRLDHAVMASDGGQLNPEWVEWLMGWPSGWTDLKPLGMDRFQEWRQQHSIS